MAAVQSAPARHWVGTINNYRMTESPIHYYPLYFDYVVVGSEIGQEGTPHLQFFVSCKRKMRLSALRKILKRAHLEVMRGTPKQASDYCKKDGHFWEEGVLAITAGEAQQDKWREIHDLAKAKDVDGFFEKHAQQSFLNPKKFQELQDHYTPAAQPLPVIDARWYKGPSGTGKSLAARTEFPAFYLKPTGTKWWPGYKGEETVVIDDLGKTHGYMLEYLKNWADHYPFRAETKGGHTGLIRPVRLIVTTQYHWDELTEDTELRAAIARRFVLRVFQSEEEEFVFPYGGFGQDEFFD